MEIDIKDTVITINGKEFPDKVSVEAVRALLGEPRIQKLEPDKNYRAYMENRRGKDYFEKSRSLVWDDLGIYTHTEDGELLVSLGIVLDNSHKTAPHTPKSNFSGDFKINGADWLTAIRSGQNMFGNYCKLSLKRFVVFAEYTAEKTPLSQRTKSDFTLIEITHEYKREKL